MSCTSLCCVPNYEKQHWPAKLSISELYTLPFNSINPIISVTVRVHRQHTHTHTHFECEAVEMSIAMERTFRTKLPAVHSCIYAQLLLTGLFSLLRRTFALGKLFMHILYGVLLCQRSLPSVTHYSQPTDHISVAMCLCLSVCVCMHARNGPVT